MIVNIARFSKWKEAIIVRSVEYVSTKWTIIVVNYWIYYSLDQQLCRSS